MYAAERPLILPIYFSSSAFNFAAMSSYVNFCFMYHIRFSAFSGEHGSLRDGLAETFYFYSQNLPTVALLMPRAALSLALLLAFSSPDPGAVALADAGIGRRDGTFFRASDETLTNYARGVLIANAAWTAWRILVLLISWYVSLATRPLPWQLILRSPQDRSVDRQRTRLCRVLRTTVSVGGRGRGEDGFGVSRQRLGL